MNNKKRLITDIDEDGVILKEYELSIRDEKGKDQLDLNTRSSFVKLYRKIEPKYKTKQFKLFFHYLARNLRKDSNAILMFPNDNKKGVPTADLKDIAEILGISLSHCNKFIAESIKIGAISRTRISDEVVFVVNPVYAFYGRYVNISLFETFKHCPDFINALSKADIELINQIYNMGV